VSVLLGLLHSSTPHLLTGKFLLSGLYTDQQEHKEPLRDVVEASRHHSSTGDT
jgi:hypothetical protein